MLFEIEEGHLAPDVALRLSHWLGRPANPGEILDWLQGYALPPVGHDDEPYIWMLRGLPVGGDQHEVERSLAERLAEFFKSKPDTRPLGDQPSQVLYNGLMLAAGLAVPEILGPHLLEIYQRRALKGAWLGIDLRSALTSALVANQTDFGLAGDWQRLLKFEDHDFLIGKADQGFEGVLAMTRGLSDESEQATGSAWAEIGKAIVAMAEHMHGQQRRGSLRQLFCRVRDAFAGRPTLNLELLKSVDEHGLPSWGADCLPSLFVPEIEVSPDLVRVFLWAPYRHVINCGSEPTKELDCLWDGCVYHVETSRNAIRLLDHIVPEAERLRLGSPFQAVDSWRAVAVEAMVAAEDRLQYSEPDTAAFAREARALMLPRSRRLPSGGHLA